MSSRPSGRGISTIALTFSGSGFRPSVVSRCPWNGTSLAFNSSFWLLSLMPFYWHLLINRSKLPSWSASFVPWIRTSSAMHLTPGRPSNSWWRCFWNISLETLTPKGNRSQQYRPYGIAKVVSMLDSSSSSRCQNADAQSTLVNTRASVRSGNKSSTTGIW